MKRANRIPQTLNALRQLPLEVSFQQVEQWVNQRPVYKIKSHSWWTHWWLDKHFKQHNN